MVERNLSVAGRGVRGPATGEIDYVRKLLRRRAPTCWCWLTGVDAEALLYELAGNRAQFCSAARQPQAALLARLDDGSDCRASARRPCGSSSSTHLNRATAPTTAPPTGGPPPCRPAPPPSARLIAVDDERWQHDIVDLAPHHTPRPTLRAALGRSGGLEEELWRCSLSTRCCAAPWSLRSNPAPALTRTWPASPPPSVAKDLLVNAVNAERRQRSRRPHRQSGAC